MKVEVKLFNRDLQEKLGLVTAKQQMFKFPYATKESAAFDLYAVIEEKTHIYPNQIKLIGTGLGIHISSFDKSVLYGMRLYIRSGVSSYLTLTNSVGLIDPDYQGELILKVKNHSLDTVVIDPGERIAQAEFFPVYRFAYGDIVNEFSIQTQRADGGFGSTGKTHPV